MSDKKDFMQNAHLPGDDFYWQGNKTGFLLNHGFTATTAEVRLIAELLHKEGYSVSAPLLPGHGTHPDDLNNASWEMWVHFAKKAY